MFGWRNAKGGNAQSNVAILNFRYEGQNDWGSFFGFFIEDGLSVVSGTNADESGYVALRAIGRFSRHSY